VVAENEGDCEQGCARVLAPEWLEDRVLARCGTRQIERLQGLTKEALRSTVAAVFSMDRYAVLSQMPKAEEAQGQALDVTPPASPPSSPPPPTTKPTPPTPPSSL
jgi:hypothetical protein